MNIGKILAGMGILIGMYLVLSRGSESANIIKSLASATTSTVSTLQGRG